MKRKDIIKSLSETKYEMKTIDTSVLIIPRDTYQRPLEPNEVKEIIATFNPYLCNEPKVSFRDGKYYVFDGQHTHVLVNDEIRCRWHQNNRQQPCRFSPVHVHIYWSCQWMYAQVFWKRF